MPFDVLWLDIEYTDNKRYFQFDKYRFDNIEVFHNKIRDEKKKLTIITDPHIKVDPGFFVYSEGMDKIVAYEHERPVRGAFVRDFRGQVPFIGECWSKMSVWIDFLNENGRNFWSGLYKYDKFKGTNDLYGYWIDMNEPSVFSGDELTMPKNAIHLTKNNEHYLHKDLHNAYGILSA